MFVRPLCPNPTLADRFGWMLQCMFDAIGFEWRRRGVTPAMQTAISQRFFGFMKRLNAVFAKWRAGTLRPPRARGMLATDGVQEDTSDSGPPPQEGRENGGGTHGAHWSSLVPRRRGWLRRLLPDSAWAMDAMHELLADAEMQAIIAAAPQVGRILRPFCHFLGLEVPAELRLPKRARRQGAVSEVDPSPRPAPARGEGDEDAPRRRRSPRQIAEPPRGDNCQPPETGDGDRPRPLPEDDAGDFKERD